MAHKVRSSESRAARRPKEFQIRSKEKEISRRGDEIVLREKEGSMAQAFELLAGLPKDALLR